MTMLGKVKKWLDPPPDPYQTLMQFFRNLSLVENCVVVFVGGNERTQVVAKKNRGWLWPNENTWQKCK